MHKDDLRHTEALVEGLQARQRGYEFIVRDEMNRVLGGRSLEDILHDAAMADISNSMQAEMPANGVEAPGKAGEQYDPDGHIVYPVEPQAGFSTVPDALDLPF